VLTDDDEEKGDDGSAREITGVDITTEDGSRTSSQPRSVPFIWLVPRSQSIGARSSTGI